ncbi:MAG: hypothetical protein ACE5IH_10665, partial [Thermodesulfobacteriota bacterium]
QNLDRVTPSFNGASKRILLQGHGVKVKEIEKYLADRGVAVGRSLIPRSLPQLQIVANKRAGHYTGPFDAIVLLDDTPLRKAPSSAEFTVVSNNGIKIHTTVKDFLQRDIPITKLDQALHNEFTMTQQFRQGYGKPKTWNEWFHGGPNLSQGLSKPAAGTFKPIPVSSFGQDKIADVWYWDASGASSTDAARRIFDFAKTKGENQVVIRSNDLIRAKAISRDMDRLGISAKIIPANPEGRVKTNTVTAGMSLNTKNPIVVGLYDYNKKPEAMFTQAMPSNLPDNKYLVRSNDDVGNILPMVQKITKQSNSGKVLLMGGSDLYTFALKMQFADRGLEVIKAPPLPDALRNFNKNKFDALIGVKGPPLPSGLKQILKNNDEYKYIQPPPCPDCFNNNWNLNLDFMEQKGLIKPYTPPKVPMPGGVSMKEFAKTWVDRGDWPLVIGFGLGYEI